MATFSLGAKTGNPVVQSVIGPWTAFTPVYNNIPVTAAAGRWRQVGDSMEVVTQADPTGAATGTITVTIPLGASIDTAKITSTSTFAGNLGTAQCRPINGASAALFTGFVQYASATSVLIYGNNGSAYPGSASVWDASNPAVWVASADSISLHFTVPIVGWDATVAYGAGQALAARLGLVMGGTVPGKVDGTAIATGYIGERLDSVLTNTALADVAGTDKTVGTLALTAGVWMVYATLLVGPAGTTSVYTQASISTVNNAGRAKGATRVVINNNSISALINVSPLYITTTGQTVYLTASIVGTGTIPSTNSANSEFYAIRVG